MPMSPRLLRPRDSSFSPRTIAGMVLWLDASIRDSLTLDGTAVTAWQSRLDTVAVTQSTTNNAPAYVSSVSGLNNRPALLFDGTNDVLRNTTTGLLATGQPAMTMIFAHRTAATLGNNCIFDIAQGSSYAGTGTIRRFFVSQVFGGAPPPIPATNAPYFAYGGRDFVYNNSITAASTAYVHSLVFPGGASSATNPTYYRNGASSARTTPLPTDGSVTFTPERFSVGSSSQGASEFYSGHVAEVLLYSRALPNDERLAIERYLGSKYGITVA